MTANSLTSVTVMVKVWVGERAVGDGGLDGDGVAGGGLVVEQRAVGDGDHAGGGVDGEAAAGIVGQRVGDRVGRPSASVAKAVMPTAVPLAAFSATVLAAALVSVGPSRAAATSVTLMVKVWVVNAPLRVAGLHGDVVAGGRLAVEQRAVGDGDHAGGRVDGEAAAGIVGRASR